MEVIYKVHGTTPVFPNTSKFLRFLFRNKTWQGAFDLLPRCHIFGPPLKLLRPTATQIVALFKK